MCSGPDPWASLLFVASSIREAEEARCSLICFPENVFYRGPRLKRDEAIVLNREGSHLSEVTSFSKALAELIQNTHISISFGSILEQSSESSRPYNAHWWVGPDRKIISYRKLHLFCFQGEVASYDEEKFITRGESIQSVAWGDFCFGLSICYDLRFPELYRKLAMDHGANVFVVPSAFTRETGKVHWHTLLRARAIENLAYVIAPGQWGEHESDQGQKLSCYGHSLVYDPWGRLLAEAPEQGDALLIVDLERTEIDRRRSQLGVYESASRSLFWSGC